MQFLHHSFVPQPDFFNLSSCSFSDRFYLSPMFWIICKGMTIF